MSKVENRLYADPRLVDLYDLLNAGDGTTPSTKNKSVARVGGCWTWDAVLEPLRFGWLLRVIESLRSIPPR
jgi:hypothetical protein